MGTTFASLHRAMLVPDARQIVGRPGTSHETTEPYAGKPRKVTYIAEDPAELARTAGLDLDTYALARMLASEGYGDTKDHPEETRKGRAVAAVAQAQIALRAKGGARGLRLALLGSFLVANRGRFGSQGGRYASTRHAPTKWHVQVAQAVIRGELPNITANATQFLDPTGAFTVDYPTTLASWTRTARWIGPLPTIASGWFQAFAPERSAEVRERSRTAALAASFSYQADPRDPDQLGSAALGLAAILGGLGLVLLVILA